MNRNDFYKFLKFKRCVACGDMGSEVAHLRVMSSERTSEFMPRSHHTIAAWAAIPLCPVCHRDAWYSIHNIGEAQFEANHGWPKGYLAGLVVRFLAEYIEMKGGD